MEEKSLLVILIKSIVNLDELGVKMRSIDVELLDDLKTALWEGTLTAFCMVIFITTITISVSKKEGNKVFGLELVGSALVQTNSKPFKVVGAQ